MELTTFSNILSQLMTKLELNTKEMHIKVLKKAEEKGNYNTISYPAFASYVNFRSVPNFERASFILDVLSYEISAEDLVRVLDYSKKELKKMQTDKKDVYFGLRLNPKKIGSDLSASQLEMAMRSRAEEVCDGKANLNQYITHLVKEDLKKNGFDL